MEIKGNYEIKVPELKREEMDERIFEGAQNWRPDADGKLTFEEAIWWYRLGKGQPLYVDLNSIDLGGARASSFEGGVNSSYTFNLFKLPPTQQGLIYGNITLFLMDNNKVFAYPDNYDFDLKLQNGTFARDVFTIMGQYYNGAGSSYYIYFFNSVPVKP
jgi:hypothetical protein